MSADIDFDWMPGGMPTNPLASNIVEQVSCGPHHSNYAITAELHFDNNAHVISLSFSDRGDFGSDQKLKDANFLDQMMAPINDLIDTEK